MPWKHNDGGVSELRPTRVRLPNAETRTAKEVTDEVLAEAGWTWEEPVVVVEPLILADPELILSPPESNTTDTPVFTLDGIVGNISTSI